MNIGYPFRCALIVATVASLAACGGGGGGGDGDGGDNPPPPPQDHTSGDPYLFFASSLIAIDPANPGAPITVESGAIEGARPVQYASLDSHKMAKNIGYDSVVYIKEGKLYRVSTAKSGSLTPVRISAETQAHNVCDSKIFSTAGESFKAYYFYQTAGANTVCGNSDDIWKRVRVTDDDSVDPLTIFTPPLMSLTDVSTQQINGWLIADDGQLKTTNLNFDSTTSIKGYANVTLMHRGLLHSVLEIDGGLYIFNDETDTLSPNLHNKQLHLMLQLGPRASDYHYLADGRDILRVKKDGSAAATLTHTVPPSAHINTMASNDQYIYVSWFDSNSVRSGISRIDAATHSVSNIAEFSGEVSPVLMEVTNDFIYFNSTLDNDRIQDVGYARLLNTDGTVAQRFDHASWGGILVSRSRTMDMETFKTVDTVILMEGADNILNTAAGAIVSSYNLHTGQKIATLGQVPDDVEGLGGAGLGSKLLISAVAQADAPNPFQFDVFYVDVEKNNSLYRITHSKDKNEEMIYY